MGMELEKIDFDGKNKTILEELDSLQAKINIKREEIKQAKLKRKIEVKNNSQSSEQVLQIVQENEDISFNDEFSYYLRNYKYLDSDFKDSDIKAILPSKKHKQYREILFRLSLESIKEIREIREVLRNSELDEEDIKEFEEMIDYETRKIDFIRNRLLVVEQENILDLQEEKNNIILVPTISGNIRIIDELEHIPSEYYDGFVELINSIVDGTFKNVKTFKNDNNLIGISEVKGFKIRVIFTRLNANSYALISAFVKKSDNDKLYHESLSSKVFDYFLMESDLKEKISDEDFIKENDANVEKMWNVLLQKSNTKQLRRGQ
jgi:hypothetical protein